MTIDIILGSVLICLTFFLLTVLIFKTVKNYIRHKNIIKAQQLVKEDFNKNNIDEKHNVILNNKVSSAINSARDSMKGVKK